MTNLDTARALLDRRQDIWDAWGDSPLADLPPAARLRHEAERAEFRRLGREAVPLILKVGGAIRWRGWVVTVTPELDAPAFFPPKASQGACPSTWNACAAAVERATGKAPAVRPEFPRAKAKPQLRRRRGRSEVPA